MTEHAKENLGLIRIKSEASSRIEADTPRTPSAGMKIHALEKNSLPSNLRKPPQFENQDMQKRSTKAS